ncbi:Panacea domain-containing protein [Enorma phocaeensis]|uniref:SocA family protein n=1 Tax=Enorma phocaeensis TaxID=1871019 RepID=A0A921IXE3_9ACTN|nr:Panacea domain-containing protein [Enorma phocaeensis]HJG38009.1 SocA family protein [Enorma phocaeensis]
MTANDAARFMVNLCINDGQPISNLQLQKILYFCQLESYRRSDAPLFSDDFEAWRYGPVIPSVYRLFSIFGGLGINRKVKEHGSLSNGERELVQSVTRRLRGLRPWELVAKTHSSGSPWDIIYGDGSGAGDVIPKKLIRESVYSSCAASA